MIDAKNLSEFLTCNVHPELYPHFFVISRNGKLVAYSSPLDINQLEDEAALVAMTWKDFSNKLSPTPPPSAHAHAAAAKQTADPSPPLKALTIESDARNILIRPIQANLLLVLVGGLAPGAVQSFKITPETTPAERYPEAEDGRRLEEDVVALTAGGGAGVGVLRLQRRKLDLLADTILAEATRLKMPDDSQYGQPFS